MKDIIKAMTKGMTDRGISTSGRNTIYRSFYSSIVELEPEVKKIFKDTPDVFNIEFFPNGLGEYDRAGLLEQGFLTSKIKDLVKKYSDKFDAETVDLFVKYDLNYNTAGTDQTLKAQFVTSNSSDYKEILNDFQDQEWKNILVVSGAYSKTPAKAKTFFKPSVLHPYHKNSQGVPIAKALKLTLKALSILLADFTYTAAEKIIIENPGKVSIWYFTTAEPLTLMVIPDDAVEVGAGEEVMVAGSSLKKCFYVANKETDKTAKVELSLM